MHHEKDGKASPSSERNRDKLLEVCLIFQQPVLGQRDRSSQLATVNERRTQQRSGDSVDGLLFLYEVA